MEGAMHSSKPCFKCGITKPIDQFYRHPMMGDGHLGKCKECAKADVHANRWKQIDKYRAYDRERGKLPERLQSSAAHSRAWHAEDKRRMAAHNAVARAIKSGKLVRRPCERCGAQKSLAHHEDYDRKLDVVWLCQPCHKERHKQISACVTRLAETPPLPPGRSLTG